MPKFNDFYSYIDLSELRLILIDKGVAVKYTKGEYFAHEGSVCKYIGIVKSGYFKYTSLSTRSDECVTGFSFAEEIVTDYVKSFLFGEPSATSIVAGCDSEIIRMSVKEMKTLLEDRDPYFNYTVISVLLKEAYQRYLDTHIKTAAERYEELCSRINGLEVVIPLYELASYLSISRRQLHRIRGDV